MLPKLLSLIVEHNNKEKELISPEQIDTCEFTKIRPTVDSPKWYKWENTNNAAIVENGVITVRTGMDAFQPVFGREQLNTGQSCEVEIVDSGYCRNFMIGVATADLRNRVNEYYNNNSLYIHANGGTLFSDGNSQ